MTTKIKITMTKSDSGYVAKCVSDVVVQDCNLQISKEQFDSMLAVKESLNRMLISWNFLQDRPNEKLTEDKKKWWKYSYLAVLDQRVRPYVWNNIKKVRENYRNYMETYKQIILNPNDTELKLDLQKYEDHLSIINIVIARQQARLLVQSRSMSEKNFWSMLPSPERTLLCKKIGFYEVPQELKYIEYKYNFRMGNINLSLTNTRKEIILLTLTQINLNIQPNYMEETYKTNFKIEGLILEGSNEDEQLTSIMASEHIGNSAPYVFNIEIEKMPTNSPWTYRLNMALDSIECLYNKVTTFLILQLYTNIELFSNSF